MIGRIPNDQRGVSSIDIPEPGPARRRDKIQKDIQAFLLHGGTIEILPPNKMSEPKISYKPKKRGLKNASI